MTNVRINHEERTIVITKKFAKDASKYNSQAYKELRDIKNDNLGYKVEVREASRTTSSSNKITLATMENYIAKHDATGEIMRKFVSLRDEELGENLQKTSFFGIKKWFFETYPELKNVA
jgi:hypothetical protein